MIISNESYLCHSLGLNIPSSILVQMTDTDMKVVAVYYRVHVREVREESVRASVQTLLYLALIAELTECPVCTCRKHGCQWIESCTPCSDSGDFGHKLGSGADGRSIR